MRRSVSRSPRRQDNTKAIILALVVHGFFILFLIFGVSWHRSVSSTFQAELWTDIPKPEAPSSPHPTLAPQPEPPQPHPKPEPPKPEPPKPEPPKPLPPPVKPLPPVEPSKPQSTHQVDVKEQNADIALKKRKQAEEAKAKEAKAKEEKAKEAKAKKIAREKQMKELLKQEQEEARQELLDDIRHQKAKAAAAKVKALQEKKAAEAAAKQAAEQEVQLDAFKLAIIAKIKHHTKVPLSVPKGSTTIIKITVLPDGTVLNKVITQSSGNTAYDQAVLEGIDRSQPLPLPDDIKLRRQFRDMELNFTHEK
ncbi:IgA-specific serine endopeptidase autotransporter precursor [Ferrovum sp. JA12]|uniref:cell envelope integrity protein TolA n=1 Tax=Ferrovum sp. JA12 TaxID=1356299 RepID=UPI00070298A0|nr:cell envelope integrity protein TolA [Ferrovum sp. JA12]KRH77993.1 IgA-specific serine endopeptidase autotransporter precursor [Ferrovum sp. JA12]